jgi:hypothetical protein
LLLLHVAAPQSYVDLRTVDGIVHPSFPEVCSALGLLWDDQEYVQAMTEAVSFQESPQLRMLFGSLPVFIDVGSPGAFWESFNDNMIDVFAHRERVATNDPNLQVNLERLYVKALWHIERYLRSHSKSLSDYGGMPFPITSHIMISSPF